jgi:hypothetical protein
VKNSNMQKSAIKDLVYGGLEEIINNRNHYYKSSVGGNYCHFTESGKEAVMEYISLMAYKITEAEDADLDRRAKEQVLKELKS